MVAFIIFWAALFCILFFLLGTVFKGLPIVAGIASLALEMNPSLSCTELKDILINNENATNWAFKKDKFYPIPDAAKVVKEAEQKKSVESIKDPLQPTTKPEQAQATRPPEYSSMATAIPTPVPTGAGESSLISPQSSNINDPGSNTEPQSLPTPQLSPVPIPTQNNNGNTPENMTVDDIDANPDLKRITLVLNDLIDFIGKDIEKTADAFGMSIYDANEYAPSVVVDFAQRISGSYISQEAFIPGKDGLVHFYADKDDLISEITFSPLKYSRWGLNDDDLEIVETNYL